MHGAYMTFYGVMKIYGNFRQQNAFSLTILLCMVRFFMLDQLCLSCVFDQIHCGVWVII